MNISGKRKKIMKKLFLGLGAVAAVVTPVVAVVSCGSSSDEKLSGKLESLSQVFKDAKLSATTEQLKAFEAAFGKDATYEFEVTTQAGTAHRHLVLIKHETRLTLEQAKAKNVALVAAWKGTEQLGGTDTTYPVKAQTFQGAQLTDAELKDKGFAYTFETNDNGHIRVRAIVEVNGALVEYDKPVFAIDLTPIK